MKMTDVTQTLILPQKKKKELKFRNKINRKSST